MKKRILAVVLGAVMVMSLAGCGSGTSGEDKSFLRWRKDLYDRNFPVCRAWFTG